jgi:hypothetical protein
MTALAGHLQDYLRMRRGLGFALSRIDSNLRCFVGYLDAAGERTVTVELAVAWAQLPANIKPITVCFRLSAVRGFARYLHAVDPAHQIPRQGYSQSRGGDPSPTCIQPANWPFCWQRRGGCGHHCGQPHTRRSSACLPPAACGSERRWRLPAPMSTLLTE